MSSANRPPISCKQHLTRFYPDFLLKMESGPLLAIGYKGKGGSIENRYRDSAEKNRIGNLWAQRSEGRCKFVWVENKN